MKSEVLKDIYNLKHNAKSMLLLLLVMAFWLIPMSGPLAYILSSALLCSMMIVTTFVFDDASKWTKYAMIMPVSRKDIVRGKYLSLAVFSLSGSITGLILGSIGGLITHKINLLQPTDLISIFSITIFSFVIAMFLGSLVVPLLFEFGSAQSRVLTIAAFVVPFGLVCGVYQLLNLLNIKFTDEMILILLAAFLVVAAMTIYLMYLLSCRIFSAKEL